MSQNTPIMQFVEGMGKCSSPAEQTEIWQLMGYVMALVSVLGALRNLNMLSSRRNRSLTDDKKIGLFSLIVVQLIGAYILFSHCLKCNCWVGFWKGMFLSLVAAIIAELVYGENLNIERLRQMTR